MIRCLERHLALSQGAGLDELRALLLSIKLEYPDGRVCYSRRGALMGLPLSFTFLSLMHYFVITEACLRCGFDVARIKE